MSNAGGNNNSIQAQLSALQSSVNSLTSIVNSQSVVLNNISATLNSQTTKLNDINSEIDSLQTSINNINNSIAEIEASINAPDYSFDPDDYLWVQRYTGQLLGRRTDLINKYKYNAIIALAETTNINPRNIAGYITPLIQTPYGFLPLGERFTLPNKEQKLIILPKLKEYRIRFDFAFPVGNCRLKIWEGERR